MHGMKLREMRKDAKVEKTCPRHSDDGEDDTENKDEMRKRF